MLHKEEWMEIHVLKAQGLSEREIARKLGISRNTVSRYLDAPAAPKYKMREPRPTKLEPFKAYVERRIAEAQPDWIPAPAMLRELRAQGYVGQIRQLQDFMQSRKPAVRDDPVVRFETAPAHQLQVDFVVFRRARDPLYAFTATLGYSRWRWVRFTSDETAATLVDCHHALFEAMGGVPREILYDNAKSVVIKRDAYREGQHRWNDDFLNMAKLYGFMPRLCRPYRARTKGKVERFHRYLRGNFYVPLDSRMRASGLVVDAATANAEVGKWLRDVANRRVHPQTGHAPHTLYENVEKVVLLPLPTYLPKSAPNWPATRTVRQQIHSLQHPLSVYQQMLTEVVA
ncbi:MAG: IS21 family transposase [Acidobacteriaceae bacterium]|nr:IS21 family transposase [Acidobacteriaceae bacterium]